MGAFHDGPPVAHAPRPRRARDVVVVSLFVNPTQFTTRRGPRAYPRDEARDAALAAAAGADLLFAPAPEEVYPAGFATDVARRHGLTEPLEGAARGPEHFHGVTTVVTKLLNMVGPDVAYFGQKDAQQALVIRRSCATSTCPSRSRSARPCASPTAWRCPAATRYLEAPTASARVALTAALRRRRGTRSHARRARRRRDRRRRARAALAEHDVEPEYLELVSADDAGPGRAASTARRARRRRRPRRAGPPHRQHHRSRLRRVKGSHQGGT